MAAPMRTTTRGEIGAKRGVSRPAFGSTNGGGGNAATQSAPCGGRPVGRPSSGRLADVPARPVRRRASSTLANVVARTADAPADNTQREVADAWIAALERAGLPLVGGEARVPGLGFRSGRRLPVGIRRG